MEELQTSLCAIDGETLMDMPLALPRFCVGGLLPQGLSILGGAPKIGKSWLVLDLCVRIAKGEPIWNLDTIPGTTLYLCLEDPLHRVQQRLACVTDEAPTNAYFATVAGSLADDLEGQILSFLREHPDTVLIVVDTFQMVRGNNGEPTYGSDYQEMQKLKRIADSQRISILLVHHLRKQGDRDPINKLSGTTGISGAADAIFVLEKDERRTDAAKLICTGRDIEYRELQLQFSKGSCTWEVLSDSRDAPENLLPGEMTAFLNFMKDAKFFSGGNSDLADVFNQHSGLNVNPKSLKRINNHDKSTYIYMEGKFPAIVSQEDWHRAQAIKAGRMMESFSPQTGKRVRHCVQENKDLWGSKLRCACGCGFRKNVWHRYEDRPTSYGYKCYNILNNGSAKQRRDAGADDTGYCDQPMIADWKLELMGKAILEQVFREQRDLIQYTINLIRQSYRTPRPAENNMANLTARMERIKAKKETLLDMRTEGEITKEEFLAQRQKLDAELQKLTEEQERLAQTNTIDLEQPEWGRIQNALEEILDLSQPKPSPDLIRKFVTQVVPIGKTNFCWYLNLDGRGTTNLDMTVEGRKNHANLTFGGEHYAPPEENGIIDLKNACLCPTPHRLLSRNEGIERLPRFGTFTVTAEDAKEYLHSFSTRRRVYKFQDITVNLYI